MASSSAKVEPLDKANGEPAAVVPPGDDLEPFPRKKVPRRMSIREQIYENFEDPGFSTFAKWYSIGMMLLIVLATACFVLETEAMIPGALLYDTAAFQVFTQIELVSVVIFSLEYLIRLCTCPLHNWGLVRFIFAMPNIVDLLACLPYWVTKIVVALNPGMSTAGLGFVRVIRLVRVFRVFKFGKYSHGIQMIFGAISRSTQPLSILAFSLVIAVIIMSSIMHMAEGDVSIMARSGLATDEWYQTLLDTTGYDALGHSYCFGTIPRCFWWAFITMTTVGYGDCYPITAGGKVLAVLTSVLGVLILALPITVVGSNFQKMVEMYDEESSTMREFDASEDGNIDLEELRAFISAKRKDNCLKKDVDLNPARLMAKYDAQDNGTLSFEEFAALKREVIDPVASDPQANMRLLLSRVKDHDTGLKQLRAQMNRIEHLLEVSMGREGEGQAAEAAHQAANGEQAGSLGVTPRSAQGTPRPERTPRAADDVRSLTPGSAPSASTKLPPLTGSSAGSPTPAAAT